MSVLRGKVIFEGGIASTADTWSMGYHIPDVSTQTVVQLQDLVNECYTDFLAQVWAGTSIAGNINNTTSWSRMRLQDIDATNHVLRTVTSSTDTPTPGGTSTNSLPSEVAVCISLTTALAGARHRGRMYFPALASNALTIDGLLSSAVRADLAESMQDYFEATIAHSALLRPQVYSRVLDALFPCTALRVGSVFDSQRRRRSSIHESYTVLPL